MLSIIKRSQFTQPSGYLRVFPQIPTVYTCYNISLHKAMVAPVTKFNNIYSKPTLGLGPNSSEPATTNLSREELANLSQAINTRASISEINPINEIRNSPKWFDPFMNVAKSIGSLALKGMGIVGASLAFLTYFVFNLKTFSVILGIPTLTAFYLSYALKNKIKESGISGGLDPIKGLQQIIHEEKISPETDPSMLLKYIHDVREIYNSTRSYEAETVLKAVELMVDAKVYELQRLGDADSHDMDTVEFQKNLERYKEALTDWNLEVSNESNYVERQNQSDRVRTMAA